MGAKIIAAEPPYPMPDFMRERAHKQLDEILNAYQWDSRGAQTTFGWDSPKSTGWVRIVVEHRV